MASSLAHHRPASSSSSFTKLSSQSQSTKGVAFDDSDDEEVRRDQRRLCSLSAGVRFVMMKNEFCDTCLAKAMLYLRTENVLNFI